MIHALRNKSILTVLLCGLLFVVPIVVFGQTTPDIGIGLEGPGNPIPLEVSLGSDGTSANNLTDYIVMIYGFIVSAIGIIATVMIMFHGFGWVIAAGNAEAIGKAKEGIISAIIGLILAFTSYALLYIINPATVNFAGINIPSIRIALTGGSPAATGAGGPQGKYTMSICSTDNQDLATYPYDPAPCSPTSRPGGSMTRTQVVQAINNYRGSASPIFITSIMITESGGHCTNARSTFYSKQRAGATGNFTRSGTKPNYVYTDVGEGHGDYKVGHACGLTQFLPSTARSVARKYPECGLVLPIDDDNDYWSSKDDEVCSLLSMNPEKVICLTAKHFGDLATANGGNEVYMAAGYNAGQGRNEESSTCPTYTQWQCEANESFLETRKYIGKTDTSKKYHCTHTFGGTVTGSIDGSHVRGYVDPAASSTPEPEPPTT